MYFKLLLKLNRQFTLSIILMAFLAPSLSFAAIENVKNYGAIGDGLTNDQNAIQEAVDACSKAGGGTVLFPAGEYLSGTIVLEDNISLYLESGAVIKASRDLSDYSPQTGKCLIYAKGKKHISIAGMGSLYGQGENDYGRRKDVKYEKLSFRTGVLYIEQCSFVKISDINMLYSDSWTVHLKRCENVSIDNVTILNNPLRVNSDGIDPNSCKNVTISNCNIVAGDDCIVFKSTEKYPCENIVVENCILESIAAAIKIGTESHGDFRDIHVSNCVIKNSRIGLGFNLKDGATIERITFSDISITTHTFPFLRLKPYPIHMDIEKRHPDSKIGKIRDVTFRDIQIKCDSKVLIQGLPESPIENLTFENITIRIDKPLDFSQFQKHIGGSRTTHGIQDTLYARHNSYFTFANIHGLTLSDIKLFWYDQPSIRYDRLSLCLNHVDRFHLEKINSGDIIRDTKTPVYLLNECRNGVLWYSQKQEKTRITGASTANIHIHDFLNLKNDPVVFDNNVNKNSVFYTVPGKL